MNQREIGKLKDYIIDKIIHNKEIVDLLQPDKDDDWNEGDLIYSQVFNYNRLPFTEQEAKTVITVDVNANKEDIETIRNDTVKVLKILINVFTSDNLMKVDGTRVNRVDLISSYIDEMFNEQQHLGVGKLHLSISDAGVLDTKHPYRLTVFKLVVGDNARCKMNS